MLVSEVQTFPKYFEYYFSIVDKNNHLLEQLKLRKETTHSFFSKISVEKWDYQYAPNKWAIKKVLQHILDAELIFDYRALCIVRGEQENLPGWDEDLYAKNVLNEDLDPKKLLKSLSLQLDYTENLFSNFSHFDLKKIGRANNFEMEVSAIGFAIIGHDLHHQKVINDLYLQNH